MNEEVRTVAGRGVAFAIHKHSERKSGGNEGRGSKEESLIISRRKKTGKKEREERGTSLSKKLMGGI